MPKFLIIARRLVPETAIAEVEAPNLEAAMHLLPPGDDHEAWDVEEGIDYAAIPSDIIEVREVTETVVFRREEQA